MRGFSPEIYTPRTVLRRYGPADLGRFTELMLDNDIQQYMGGEHVGSVKEAEALFGTVQHLYSNPPQGRHFEIWAITVDGEIAGHFEMKQTPYTVPGELEVVYFLSGSHWGQGLMTEVLRAVNRYAKNMNRSLIATIDPGNAATVRVLEKVGIIDQGNLEVAGETIFKVRISTPDHP